MLSMAYVIDVDIMTGTSILWIYWFVLYLEDIFVNKKVNKIYLN